MPHDRGRRPVVQSDPPVVRVAADMQTQGYQVIPVNPLELSVLGRPAYPRLRQCRRKSILFRSSEDTRKPTPSWMERSRLGPRRCGFRKACSMKRSRGARPDNERNSRSNSALSGRDIRRLCRNWDRDGVPVGRLLQEARHIVGARTCSLLLFGEGSQFHNKPPRGPVLVIGRLLCKLEKFARPVRL